MILYLGDATGLLSS